MAKARTARNGHLEEAMALLINNQAAFQANQTAFQAQMSQNAAQMNEHAREMADLRRQSIELERRIEERFRRIEAILMEHSRILAGLPDAVRERVGFRPPMK